MKTETKTTQCPLPPSGWYCTREIGHDGPCAANPVLFAPPIVGEIDIKRLYESIPDGLKRKVSCDDLKRTCDAYNKRISSRIELVVCYLEEDMEPFITGVSGSIGVEGLKAIEDQLAEVDEYSHHFSKGVGYYLISAAWEPDEYDFIGGIDVVINKAYWSLTFEGFHPYPSEHPGKEEAE